MMLMDITTPTLTLKHMIFPRFLAVIRPQQLELMEPNANFAGIVHIKRNLFPPKPQNRENKDGPYRHVFLGY